MGGYVGKIVRINLKTKAISYIETSKYEKWGGGHGIGSALFYDIAIVEKGLDLENMDYNSPNDGGFHPENVVTIMTSPLSATGVPAATGRTEIQGIGVQQYPICWFTRSNVGGRFGSMLKFAGYDGIVIEGASSEPVWIDIRDSSITIRQCNELGLWGMDTVDTQKAIWNYVAGGGTYGTWIPISPASESNGSTTQRPAVLTIGRAGENKSRMGCLIHDATDAAGQGGFGGVWGSKKLKAISVIGTGSVPVADPAGLLAERLSNVRDYGPDLKKIGFIERTEGMLRHNMLPGAMEAFGKTPTSWEGDPTASVRNEDKGPSSCIGCHSACKARYATGLANASHCAGCYFYGQASSREIQVQATDLINRYGFNTYDFYQGLPYIIALAVNGVIGSPGSGCEIESDIDFSQLGSLAFAKRFLETIAERDTPFGDALAEGFPRALERWGRLDDIGQATPEDQAHLQFPYWGMPEHHYDGRSQLDFGYGSILGDRDVNEHAFTTLYLDSYWGNYIPLGLRPYDATAEEAVTIFTEKMLPHANAYSTQAKRMQMLNYGTDNMYSIHIARMVSWDRHYNRFFKQSMLFCDLRWPDLVNKRRDDKRGATGWVEPRFIKEVTGNDISFNEGMITGRKIWNLDNAIWVLQGRHRDMVHFADYMYQVEYPGISGQYTLPTYDPNDSNGAWQYRNVALRKIDKTQFEEFKTRFYSLEGWNTANGWPTRTTLTALGLGYVADKLASKGKLG